METLFENLKQYDPERPKFVVESSKVERPLTLCPIVDIMIDANYCKNKCWVVCEWRKK